MYKMKQVIDAYNALPETKKHEVWEVMEKHYDALDEKTKKEMGYDLSLIVNGECLSLDEAQCIVAEMHGHGESGEHWTPDEVRSVLSRSGVDIEKQHYSLGDVYAVMHAKYYDQHEFLHGLTTSPSTTAEYCMKMAQGFLNDDDAPEHGKGKARKYFHFVI